MVEGGSEGLYEGSLNVGRLTFRCLTRRDGRCPGLGVGSQGLGTDGLRWERTWCRRSGCLGMGASWLVLSREAELVSIARFKHDHEARQGGAEVDMCEDGLDPQMAENQHQSRLRHHVPLLNRVDC